LQWHIAWTLALIAEDDEIAIELGQSSGIVSLILFELSSLSKPPKSIDDWHAMLAGILYISTFPLFNNYCKTENIR
jgi:hypothetical protein